jgi:hypothetical protein
VSNSKDSRFPFSKIIVILAIVFLIGVGLCGIDYLLAANGIGKGTEEFGVGPLDALSLAVMAFSAICLIFTLIAWAITGVVSSFGPDHSTDDTANPLSITEKVSQSENLDHQADDTNIDKQE